MLSYELQGNVRVSVDSTTLINQVVLQLDDGTALALQGSSKRLKDIFSAVLKSLSAGGEESVFQFKPGKTRTEDCYHRPRLRGSREEAEDEIESA